MYNKGNLAYVQLYKDYSDDELIDNYKAGNLYAIEHLLNRYHDTVKKMISPFYLVGADKEDLFQEAMISLYKASTDYNPLKNCSFKSYATICIKRHIITVIRRSSRQKHNPLNNYISFNLLLYEEQEFYLVERIIDNKLSDPESSIVLKEIESLLSLAIKKCLSRFEKTVLSYYIFGLSYQEISKALNKDIKSIDNALQRTKRKIKQEINL